MSFSILIIDDDASFRKIIERRLRSFIGECSITSLENLNSAREHLRSLTKTPYDLVILDEHLPDGRGVTLLSEGWFEGITVLSVSSDTAPETQGNVVQAGAAYFLAKTVVSEPLFKPLVIGVIDRNRLQRQLEETRLEAARLDTVKTLVATLRHEINNPLGAVLGAAFILSQASITEEQREAAELVEQSGVRIKEVLDKLCHTLALETVDKAAHRVFQIPGDKPWKK